jgi:hypothetical protein
MKFFTNWILKVKPLIIVGVGLAFALILYIGYVVKLEFPALSVNARIFGALGCLFFWCLLAYRIFQKIRKWDS